MLGSSSRREPPSSLCSRTAGTASCQQVSRLWSASPNARSRTPTSPPSSFVRRPDHDWLIFSGPADNWSPWRATAENRRLRRMICEYERRLQAVFWSNPVNGGAAIDRYICHLYSSWASVHLTLSWPSLLEPVINMVGMLDAGHPTTAHSLVGESWVKVVGRVAVVRCAAGEVAMRSIGGRRAQGGHIPRTRCDKAHLDRGGQRVTAGSRSAPHGGGHCLCLSLA